LILLVNSPDFDSAIRRFVPFRPSQPVRRVYDGYGILAHSGGADTLKLRSNKGLNSDRPNVVFWYERTL
jgi:hypothetical protein